MHTEYFFIHGYWPIFFCLAFSFTIFAVIGLYLTLRYVSQDFREQHNELNSYGLATISIFSAVLMAFVAVAAWEKYENAQEAVSQEAQYLSDIIRGSLVLPQPLGSIMREKGSIYLELVVHKEWPAMGKKEVDFNSGWEQLSDLYFQMSKFKSSDPTVQVIFSDLFQKLNNLSDARRSRILLSHRHFPPIMWCAVFVSAIFNIIFLFLFGMRSKRMHYAMTIFISMVIGCIFALIVSFDRPFQHSMSVSPDPFTSIDANYKSYQKRYDAKH